MRKHLLLLIVLAVAVAAVAAGCGTATVSSGKGKGTTVSQSGKTVSVSDIAKSPDAYKGKTVTVEGTVYRGPGCTECFLCKSGKDAVRIVVSSQAPLPPTSKVNSKIRVTGLVEVQSGSPSIQASTIVYK
jgi:uncharacterized protein YdeI (BOF family)